MDEFELSTKTCPLCAAGQYGAHWTRDLFSGKHTPEEAALRFHMTVAEVNEHLYSHQLVKIDNTTNELVSEDIYLSKLSYMLNKLVAWMEFIIDQGDINRGTVDSITKLTKEARSTISMMAEFQGRVNNESNQLRIDNMEVTVLNLTNVILQEACPICRAKVIEILDQSLSQDPKSISSTCEQY